jgi:bifunctional UDP-N-acetylglucosamine pyrophosphorylase/glucosamine-1-phosphate N-acetyltransferase
MVVGVILAAGKGKRFGAVGRNKTAELYMGKPLVSWGVDLLEKVTEKVVVVVGAYAESVRKAVGVRNSTVFAVQTRRLGTGHALKVAIAEIEKQNWRPEAVVLGYGDHLMKYRLETVEELVRIQSECGAGVVLVTTDYPDPDSLRWGRVIRSKSGEIKGVIEQKDATEDQRKISELNSGLYCFDYEFVKKAVKRLKKSPVSGEYYATDLVGIAGEMGYKAEAVKVNFSQVGYGANTPEELRRNDK